ncbi:MAG TPA: cysteine synthase family protein [Candidatus Thermoplasmatota archaeon]|nr:cysteine synthase family protein [Candidatus Thermoplasmatota archaeon]
MPIARSVLDLVGNTPLVRLDRLRASVNGGKGATVVAKLESRNPGLSVKARIAVPMIQDAVRRGLLKPGGTIVEATSGNTGVGLAIACSILGYRLICTAPDKITKEKQDTLKAYGAELVLCPTNVGPDDPHSYYRTAQRLAKEVGGYMPFQYHNKVNSRAHYDSTGPEIWEQTEGKVTHVVAGMGTGGTITGIGQYLHKASKAAASKGGKGGKASARQGAQGVQVIGIDTVGSIFTEFFRTGKFPKDIHQYLVEGIGEDFMPQALDWKAVDDVVQVSDEDAFLAMARLVREEGIFAGSSSGAAVAGALQVARGLPRSALVVVILPDAGEKYISKFNLEWMEDNGLTKAPTYLRKSAAARAGKKPAPVRRGT